MKASLEYGCQLSPYDVRDYKVSISGELPASYELDFSNVEVKNQKSVSSCVAHALSTILEYHAKNRNKLSTNFIYGIRKELFNQEGKGMYLRDACKIATNYGDPLESDCPGNTEIPEVYDIASKTLKNERAMKYAEDYKTKSYYLCKSNDEIKYALVNYGPILASLKWYKDYKVTNGILTGGNVKNYGYHAIVIYGYNEQGFLCQNSWGKSWGDRGRFILPYSIKLAEARGLIDVENDTYVSPPKPNNFLNNIYKFINFIINLFRKK